MLLRVKKATGNNYASIYSVGHSVEALLLSRQKSWDFPGGSVVRTPCFQAGGLGSIPDWGTKAQQAQGIAKTIQQVSVSK